MPFRLACLSILVLSLLSSASASDPISFSGFVKNTTNPRKATTATVAISLGENGDCVLRVGAPLYGSGSCSVETFDETTGRLLIHSTGPAGDIGFSGTFDGTNYNGSYIVSYPNYPELPQDGSFSLLVDDKPVIIHIGDVLSRIDFSSGGKEFHVLLDRDLGVFYDQDYKYAGIRIFLDGEQNPLWRIEDHQDGSLYIDAKANHVLMEWHTDGKDGYFSKVSDGVTSYYDRFMDYTHLSSVNVNGSPVYAYENGDSVELYDASFKSLNIRSGKTSSGKIFWMKTDTEGITEYFDDTMRPLSWYSAVREGHTYYVRNEGKNFKVYDEHFQPVQKRNGFWSNMARGFANGLAAYGQALQAQAAAANQASSQPPSVTTYNKTTQNIGNFGYSNTTTSEGNYYNTTTQRIGDFDYSTTTGSNGYHSSTTRQQIGNFGYTNGISSNGYISGTQQRIGSFDYSTYTTPQGQWTGTSQQIGNFTYHTFTGPDGSVHTGTSQQIGDFVYTSIQ